MPQWQFTLSATQANTEAIRVARYLTGRALIRVWMANRGVWESGWWLGPTLSVAHDEADVDEYVSVFGRMLAEMT
jgi:glutamate-1-semialdehyde aminotransferase